MASFGTPVPQSSGSQKCQCGHTRASHDFLMPGGDCVVIDCGCESFQAPTPTLECEAKTAEPQATEVPEFTYRVEVKGNGPFTWKLRRRPTGKAETVMSEQGEADTYADAVLDAYAAAMAVEQREAAQTVVRTETLFTSRRTDDPFEPFVVEVPDTFPVRWTRDDHRA